jgi:hypothetical protein
MSVTARSCVATIAVISCWLTIVRRLKYHDWRPAAMLSGRPAAALVRVRPDAVRHARGLSRRAEHADTDGVAGIGGQRPAHRDGGDAVGEGDGCRRAHRGEQDGQRDDGESEGMSRDVPHRCRRPAHVQHHLRRAPSAS